MIKNGWYYGPLWAIQEISANREFWCCFEQETDSMFQYRVEFRNGKQRAVTRTPMARSAQPGMATYIAAHSNVEVIRDVRRAFRQHNLRFFRTPMVAGEPVRFVQSPATFAVNQTQRSEWEIYQRWWQDIIVALAIKPDSYEPGSDSIIETINHLGAPYRRVAATLGLIEESTVVAQAISGYAPSSAFF